MMPADKDRWSMLCICSLPDEVQQELAREFDFTVKVFDGAPTALDLAPHLQGKQVLLTAITAPLSAETIAALPPSVRAIATYSVGYEHLDIAAARARNIAIFNTPDVLTQSVAENAMFLILGAARRATESIALIRSGHWQGWTARQLNGVELADKRLGILGMGRIGRAVADRARGFGMLVHYHNRNRLPEAQERGAVFHADPEEMLGQIDFLLLACPSNAETRGFLNSERIARLKQSAIVINIARGDLVVDEALIAALAGGRLFAAGLDVFNHEPKFDPRYLELPNAFVLPHIGSSTLEARRRMGDAIAQGLREWRNGRRPSNLLV